jgi:hypothetical protein
MEVIAREENSLLVWQPWRTLTYSIEGRNAILPTDINGRKMPVLLQDEMTPTRMNNQVYDEPSV